MTQVLITGGAGFIGSSLADRLLSQNQYSLVLVDNLLTGDIRKIPNHSACQYIKCDVNQYDDIAPIMNRHHFDFVFHFAAVVGVKRTINNPLMVLKDLDGIRNILELSKTNGVERVFYSSSSEVYGEPVELPQHEKTTPLNSRLPYAVVKNAGECYCRSYHKEFGLPYTILRFFNTYGVKQSDDFVISRFISAAREGRPLTIYGDGKQTRTFCYIDDNTECLSRILEKNIYVNEVMNVGSEVEYSILDVAQRIIKETGSNSVIEFLPPLPEGDMTRRCPDISKMRAVLSRDLTSLADGLRKIIHKN